MSAGLPPDDSAVSLGSSEVGGPARRVWVALSRDVERTGRRLHSLEPLVRGLAENLSVLAERVAAPGPGAAGGGQAAADGAVRSWLTAGDPERTAADLRGLVGWLEGVYLIFPNTSLPSCWLWHPEVVEELWWLYQSYLDVYHPVSGSWLRVGDWYDRQRPGVVARIRAAVASCELMLHLPPRELAQGPLPVPMAGSVERIAAWAADG
ncbi:MAG TPA: hypothetical protein VGH89_31975 [Pseudonocardia sp.]|jgi:hypothetical protein